MASSPLSTGSLLDNDNDSEAQSPYNIDDDETQGQGYLPEDDIEEEQEEDENEDEEELETQDAFDEDLPVEGVEDETQEQESMAVDDDDEDGSLKGRKAPADSTTKRKKKEPAVLERPPGKSLLPVSRVQKIIKADKDIPIVAKDAVLLISLATEEFIRRIIGAGQRVANGEHRSTVQHRDLATVVRRIDEFLFLEEIMPYLSPDAPSKKQSKVGRPAKSRPTDKSGGLLDQFKFVNVKQSESNDADPDDDVVMRDDS
ncbi:hypothetical protein DFP72DRAFT_239042 [Ephemerocybe angulata]|uniref:Transcription factor CBF/NF-Y/archaeal histone domain-containing protein n=1 Tax=Ephemerocybe angulata TaxID=980116 RepID=A0A8H6I444_9AGAR|nr:hypothetical protein DFP72DRAFT_239042 [Tulosesus angulatus]